MAVDFPFAVVFVGKDRLSGPMGRITTRIQSLGKLTTKVGKRMTLGLTLPIVALGASTLKTGVEFETSLNRVRAVGQATEEQMAAVRAEVRRLGATTKFTGSEAAEAFVFLSQAGFKTEQSVAAAGASLDLATAGMEDLRLSTDIMTDVLKGFGKQAEDSRTIADLLAGGILNATTDIATFAEGIKQFAPAVPGLNQPMGDLVTLMTALSDAGLKGAKGGNILKRMFVELLDPSTQALKTFQKLEIKPEQLFTGVGQLRSLFDILVLLGERGARTEQLLDIFGKRTFLGAQALVGLGGDALNNLRIAVTETGLAAKVSETQMQGVPGAVARMRAAFENLKLSLLESGLLDGFERMLVSLQRITTDLARTNPEFLRLAIIWGIGVAVAGPLLVATGGMLQGFAGLLEITTLLIPPMAALFALIAANPITLVIAGIVVGLTAIEVLAGKLIRQIPILGKVWGFVWDGIGAGFKFVFDLIVTGMGKLIGLLPEFIKSKLGIEGSLFEPLGEPIGPSQGAPLGAAPLQDVLSRSETLERQEATLRLLLEGEGTERLRVLEQTGDLPIDLDLGPALAGAGG